MWLSNSNHYKLILKIVSSGLIHPYQWPLYTSVFVFSPTLVFFFFFFPSAVRIKYRRKVIPFWKACCEVQSIEIRDVCNCTAAHQIRGSPPDSVGGRKEDVHREEGGFISIGEIVLRVRHQIYPWALIFLCPCSGKLLDGGLPNRTRADSS